jgi:hypothetical protein
MRLLLLLAASALIAGCGGNLGSSSSVPAVTDQSVSFDFACHRHGGVAVTPCHARFTKLFRGPVSLAVKYPNGNGTLSEIDICGDVATISGAGSSWTVSAGTARGHCSAIFNYKNSHGKIVGWAHLHIRSTRP